MRRRKFGCCLDAVGSTLDAMKQVGRGLGSTGNLDAQAGLFCAMTTVNDGGGDGGGRNERTRLTAPGETAEKMWGDASARTGGTLGKLRIWGLAYGRVCIIIAHSI